MNDSVTVPGAPNVQTQPMSQPQVGMLLSDLAPDSIYVHHATYALASALQGVMICWMMDHGRTDASHGKKGLTNAGLGSSKALGRDAQPVVCRNLDQAMNRSTCIANASS